MFGDSACCSPSKRLCKSSLVKTSEEEEEEEAKVSGSNECGRCRNESTPDMCSCAGCSWGADAECGAAIPRLMKEGRRSAGPAFNNEGKTSAALGAGSTSAPTTASKLSGGCDNSCTGVTAC